jgi:hypothetical protein
MSEEKAVKLTIWCFATRKVKEKALASGGWAPDPFGDGST